MRNDKKDDHLVSRDPGELSEEGLSGGSVLGLIAGGGRFPFLVAEAAKARGLRVVCAAIQGEAFPELAREVAVYREIGLGRLGKTFRFLHQNGVRKVAWAGWLRKEGLFHPQRVWKHRPDLRAFSFWFRKLRGRDRQSQTILNAMVTEFEEEGFHIAHSALYCPELLVEEGLLTKKGPDAQQKLDIAFGWDIAKKMAGLDVGQSVAVFEQATIAVEALEGTDRVILRAGELCRRGFVLVKVAQDGHDMRFDVPAVGIQTIETLHRAGGKVLVLEAGKTLLFDRDELIEIADRLGLVVLAISGGAAGIPGFC